MFGEISDSGKEKGGDEAEIIDRETDLNWFVNLDDTPYDGIGAISSPTQ